MAGISNTSILIKRSTTTATPTTLKAGELAYSYQSNTVFIGTSDGAGVIALGGNGTFQTVNTATSANVASTLVKRDANGAFYGRLFGVSNTAVALDTAQNFSITGDVLASAISFNGTGAVALSAALNNINPNSGTFGSTTAIPVITVGANGRITAVTTSSIATSFNINDGTTSNTINGGSTFYHLGTKGITTTVSANTVTFSTDNTIVRSNTTSVGPQTIGTDVQISGNLIVTGTQTFVNTSIVRTNDSLIQLAANNTVGDVIDIGFVGTYNNGAQVATGLVRDAGNKAYYLFKDIAASSITDANTIANNLFTAANTATLYANLNAQTGTIGTLTLTNTLTVPNGGTGQTTFTSGQMLVGSGTNGLAQIANVSTSIGQNFGSASVVPVFQTDAYGRVSAVTNTSIAIDASAVTSGTLAIARGGSNAGSYAQSGLLYYNGTSFLTSANVTAYATQGGASYVPVITTNQLGQVTAITNTQIQIDTSNITSGTLGFSRGGTGSTSYTTSQLLVAGATGFVSLANTTYSLTGALQANNTITSLTVDAYGRTTAATGAAISGLTVGQGGTGFATATTNGIVFGNGTGALGVTVAAGTSDQTWSNQILTVTNAGVPVWSSAMDGGAF
jgi:hypothetical protein